MTNKRWTKSKSIIQFGKLLSQSLQTCWILVDGMIVVNYNSEKATPGGILVSDLTIKPKELLEIVNERLAAHKAVSGFSAHECIDL